MDAAGYVRNIDSVPGWFFPEDVAAFQELGRIQTGAGFRGDVLEIGAYQGKSAILLGYGLAPGESLTVCDLFGKFGDDESERKENQRYYTGLQRQTFEQHYLRHHAALPTILECSSTELALPPQSFRFVHVDGSHQYEVARKDVETAIEVTIDGGVISFDDYRAAHTPGVAAAVWSAVVAGSLKPLLLTPHKLYAYVGTDTLGMEQRLARWAREKGMLEDLEEVAGSQCVRIAQKLPRPGLLKRIYWECRNALKRTA